MNANARRAPKHGKELPYSVSPAALGELARLIRDEEELDEGLLDSAWLGLERPSPEKRGEDHVIVTMSKSQADALRGFIDGDGVAASLVDSALSVIDRHARALSVA